MIWGCDLGTRRVAVACPELGYTAAMHLPTKRKTEAGDAAADCDALGCFVYDHVPSDATLWIEKPISGASGNRATAIHMGMAAGAVVGAHAGQSYLVLPMVWKKAVVGNGHADKEAVRRWLHQRHPALAEACQDDQDLYDATCVGLFGRTAAARELEEQRRVQRR